MAVTVKQISSLEKVRLQDALPARELLNQSALPGQRVSYQVCMTDSEVFFTQAFVRSPFADSTRLFAVKNAVLDVPATCDIPQEDYITLEPGLMPDILVPFENLTVTKNPRCIWVKVDIPADTKPGNYCVSLDLTFTFPGGERIEKHTAEMTIHVLATKKPEQKLIYTRWLYADCIATYHQVPVFSEKHWQLIEQYIAAAADLGINMILVPVHTPPLDTEVGTARPCVQLVDIEKNGDTYTFSFERFHRYIGLCKKHGIRYYEIAHMFTQWGAEHAPNIQVRENGETSYRFGWHTDAASPEYAAFLKQYIAAIARQLQKEGIEENTYFHISDEPGLNTLEKYQTASQIIRPLIGNSKTYDALSEYEFYERGLVECPVTSIHKIHEFLEHRIENQWLYYCCFPQETYPNTFLAMPSYRVRILGFLLYKYNIKGFLQWGFNFYYGCRSVYPIDPYLTTSSDGVFPSGDPFIVYPGRDCAYHSIRGEVFFEGIQDMDICYALEEKIGREKVISIIDEMAGFDLRFDRYPRSSDFILDLREALLQELKKTENNS